MEIDLNDLCDINMNDYPDFVDAYVDGAKFKSSGQLLTDEPTRNT